MSKMCENGQGESYCKKMDEAIRRVDTFRSANGVPRSKVISAVKKIVFEEYQNGEIQTHGVNKQKNYAVLVEATRYIVEEIMGLTPAEYDAIYSAALNQKACIDYAARKIVQGASAAINAEALFDAKKTLFRICWPDYYRETYKKPQPRDIFYAQGEIKSALIRAGRVRLFNDATDGVGIDILQNGRFSTKKKERRRVYNHGDEVDKIVYWAMDAIFSQIEITTSDLFDSLANPKKHGWDSYGFTDIIEGRGCYPSPLDFYMLNSPQDYQLAHIEEYIAAREKAGLEEVKALTIIYEAYRRAKGEERRSVFGREDGYEH